MERDLILAALVASGKTDTEAAAILAAVEKPFATTEELHGVGVGMSLDEISSRLTKLRNAAGV